MRAQELIFLAVCSLAVSGCALPDWMVPRIWKPTPTTQAARDAQQDRYDRQVKTWGLGPKNLMGSRDYIPGSSSNPFVPTQVSAP